MTPILIIKTTNGYAVIEYSGEIPQTDLRTLNVAARIDGSYRGDGVMELLRAHFEPPEPATKLEAVA